MGKGMFQNGMKATGMFQPGMLRGTSGGGPSPSPPYRIVYLAMVAENRQTIALRGDR